MTTFTQHLPAQWEATPYGSHWSFAYNLANMEREEYDFTVEFHETVSEPEGTAVISLIETPPELLAELIGISDAWSNAEGGSEVMDYLERRLYTIRGVIAKATNTGEAP